MRILGISNSIMTRSAISGPFRPAVLLVLPFTLAGCIHASTYGTGEAPEIAMFREMSGGLLNKNQPKKQIDYQPRAPLVMPPAAGQAGLPSPVDTAAEANPAWPADPMDSLASADARSTDDDDQNDINQAEYRRLKPLAGAFPDQQQSDEGYRVGRSTSGKDDYYRTVVHGREQRQAFAKAVADSKGFGAATERRYLTDPPVTYRAPAAGADGTVDTASAEPPKGNILTRWWRRHN
jgi:hypothetical protein